MSLVFNMVGGGSGGGGISDTDAVLIVTVPTGSTVSMTKGGTTLTPTMWVKAADNTLDIALFSISPALFDSVNAWTVTGTRGAYTSSATVVIDDNKEYDLTISYVLILVENGIVQSGITISNDVSYIDSTWLLQVTQGTGYTRLKTQNGYPGVWSTTGKIDVSSYDTMTIQFVATGLTNSPPASLQGAGIGVMNEFYRGADVNAFANSITGYEHTLTSSNNLQTVTMDISSYSSVYLITICSAWSGANSQVDVYDWRLE